MLSTLNAHNQGVYYPMKTSHGYLFTLFKAVRDKHSVDDQKKNCSHGLVGDQRLEYKHRDDGDKEKDNKQIGDSLCVGELSSANLH